MSAPGKTRLNVPPPPAKQADSAEDQSAPQVATSRLVASIPTPTFIPDNLSRSSDNWQDLNFKVSPDFHRQFKLTAASWGMSMKDLLEASFKVWLDKHGTTPGQSPDIRNK